MESSVAGTSGVRIMTRRQMYALIEQHEGTICDKLNFLENKILESDNYSVSERVHLKSKLKIIKSRFRQRWEKANRQKKLFLSQNEKWLLETEDIPKAENKQGRPKKTFAELTERGKRKRTEELRKSCEIEELRFATESKFRELNQIDASKVIHDINISPDRAKKIRAAYSPTVTHRGTQYEINKVLCVYTDAELSREQYEILRTLNKKQFPSYKVLQAARTLCNPPKEALHVTSTSAKVNLQHLLNHTATRILIHLEPVISTLTDDECAHLDLILKWGCDGSQQNQYKQKFDSENECDNYLLQSSLVPIRLCSGKKIIWQNAHPSSPRFCRPIHLRFIQETADTIREEINAIQEEINNLQHTRIEGTTVAVKHTLTLTMVDGKVCNAITGTTSTMRCYICGVTSKDFNKITENVDIDPERIKFGISILHARIKFFENLLHIAYRLPMRKWQAKSEEEKNVVKATKLKLQIEFKKHSGLLIDIPKQGFGNTNDGNTSRRFFDNPELSAAVTGLNEELIIRFKVILEVISSGYRIDLAKFKTYTMETAKLYVELYPWYPMSPTVHKVLMHAVIIIQHALLPIGQLSEEAIEAQNKYFRSYLLNHARKCSREKCLEDVLNRLLVKSDPLISSLRKKTSRRSKQFLKDTLELLAPSTQSEDEEVFSDEENTSFND